MNQFAIILAAGKGTRMKSTVHKVLHKVCGKAMVEHVVDQAKQAGVSQVITVVGHDAESVKNILKGKSEFVFQAEQLGTGHAVKQAESKLEQQEGLTIVLFGDTPLMSADTLKKAITYHKKKQASATVITAIADDPTGYGRIVRDEDGFVLKNVEQKDATPQEQTIKEINTGTYIFDNRLLFETLKHVKNDNAQKEYYLPDVLPLLNQQGKIIAAYQMNDLSECLGVNDRIQLAQVTRLMQQRINEKHMREGVTLIDPQTTYIDSDVTIGSDTIIEPNVYLKGQTSIGQNCFIGSHSQLEDMIVKDFVSIKASHLEQSTVESGSDIGPMAHIRPNSHIKERVHVGNFVEVKQSTIGQDTKMGHLTYIGDATLGERINIGCGTIVVNYDGKKKHHTTIGDDTFIGCNANLVSPVTIGSRAFVAAGSTITKDVPDEALAIARSKQENKENYAKRLPYAQS